MDIATRRAHGNSKLATSHLFRFTLSSTIKKIDTLVSEMSGSKAYKHLVATTNDEIKNLILLSFDLNGYFKLLQIQPELLVVLVHDKMKEQFSKLVLVTKETVPLYYDTTFSLGEIYVSVGTN